ncbi:MAG: hypothetical protein IJ003_00985 [Candidatus Gastranaerophilales bacterium]|nr:hypothetical protein [Candidatus Gastranaerophilales bacterium]
MKKNIIAFGVLCICLNLTCFGFNMPNFEFKKSDKSEIKTLLNKHNKAMDSRDIETLKSFYDESYISSDGFNIEEQISMLKDTYSAYSDIEYKTKINNITTFDNWALVQMSDATSAKVYPVKERKYKKQRMGILEGKSSYVVYLKKDKDSWKIISDDILMEETTLKYGIANKINMDLITPAFVKNGKEYDLSLKMNKPSDIIALASISREEITYPPTDNGEKFRKFPESGDLERLVKANNKNLDEYAVASVGFTKVSINEEQTKARIEVLGMAYIMKRINMEKPRMTKNEVKEKI